MEDALEAAAAAAEAAEDEVVFALGFHMFFLVVHQSTSCCIDVCLSNGSTN